MINNNTNRIIKKFFHNNSVAGIALSFNNKILVTGGNVYSNNYIKVWNILNG